MYIEFTTAKMVVRYTAPSQEMPILLNRGTFYDNVYTTIIDLQNKCLTKQSSHDQKKEKCVLSRHISGVSTRLLVSVDLGHNLVPNSSKNTTIIEDYSQ